jgi:hypothetical protein
MCYFEQTRWACSYWKWGNFREQCNKEYRTGETCGLRLVYQTYQMPGQCKTCDTLDKKNRRRSKMCDDVDRWSREGGRRATIERTQAEIVELGVQIAELEHQHRVRVHSTNY